MKKILFGLILFITFSLLLSSSAQWQKEYESNQYDYIYTTSESKVVHWARNYGGQNHDKFSAGASIPETSDGGYIVASKTNSYGAGVVDILVLKLTSSGDIEWQRTYGGSEFDSTDTIQEVSDGGYVVLGHTDSFGAGEGGDVWFLKLTSSGDIEWQRKYGGSEGDYPSSIQQTIDGGYVVLGGTNSFGAGDNDMWVLKLSSSGDIEWQKTYGGSMNDWSNSIQQTRDGGYVVAGITESFGSGDSDGWVLKLTPIGDVEWQRTYGDIKEDYPISIQQTRDGGYIVGGETESFGAGDYDMWVLKLSSSGDVEWQKTYGGSEQDWSDLILQTIDGGYVAAGATVSYGAGGCDGWVLKLTPKGDIKWQRTYGGREDDWNCTIQEASDGGYIVLGVTGHAEGVSDICILKLSPEGLIGPDCEFIRNSNAMVADTNISPLDTNAVPVDTNCIMQSTDVIPQEIDIDTSVICMWSGQIPAAPKRLKAKALSWRKIRLGWKDRSKIEDGFFIERRMGPEGAWEVIKKVKRNTKKFEDKGLKADTLYHYRVRAINSNGCSACSNIAKVTTKKR